MAGMLHLSPARHGRPLAKVSLWLAVLCLLAAGGCQVVASRPSVVIYTSVDQPFAEPILQDFESRTGIQVKAVYDVEAAKTTGLVSRLLAESSQPRADVFWSSEFAQTLVLKDRGALAPYDSPSAQGIPPQYRDPEAYWTGFAARARVIVANTRLLPEDRRPRSMFDLADGRYAAGEVGIASPLFGTTATHVAALYAAIGPARTQEYLKALLGRQVRVVDGNSVVRDMVASGELLVGLTDTDDAYGGVDRGDPLAVIFPDQEGVGTLVIPNTVALVKGAPHPEEAKRLIDYLLSREVEGELARGAAHQMPVRDGIPMPAGYPGLEQVKAMSVHPYAVAEQMPASAQWLREAFLK